MKPTKINWANKDEVTAYYRDYHKKKRELGKKKTYQQEYYLKNRDKIREKQNARRSKLKDNPFAKKYKEEVMGSTNLEGFSNFGDELDNASQVKSWSKYEQKVDDGIAKRFIACLFGTMLGIILGVFLANL
jgi:hypothetical protein